MLRRTKVLSLSMVLRYLLSRTLHLLKLESHDALSQSNISRHGMRHRDVSVQGSVDVERVLSECAQHQGVLKWLCRLANLLVVGTVLFLQNWDPR